jgi:hypothetical protein
MITNKQLVTLLNKSEIVVNVYDNELDLLASKNNGKYNLDDNTLHQVSLIAFNRVLGEDCNEVSWDECQAIFDLIERA